MNFLKKYLPLFVASVIILYFIDIYLIYLLVYFSSFFLLLPFLRTYSDKFIQSKFKKSLFYIINFLVTFFFLHYFTYLWFSGNLILSILIPCITVVFLISFKIINQRFLDTKISINIMKVNLLGFFSIIGLFTTILNIAILTTVMYIFLIVSIQSVLVLTLSKVPDNS